VFTARYALSPYIKQIRFVFKGLREHALMGRQVKIVRNAVILGTVLAMACHIFSTWYKLRSLGYFDRETEIRPCTWRSSTNSADIRFDDLLLQKGGGGFTGFLSHGWMLLPVVLQFIRCNWTSCCRLSEQWVNLVEFSIVGGCLLGGRYH
jgi:hypothetical protein